MELVRKSLKLNLGANEGDVTAVFATLNVIDKHGDVTVPGAFGEQNVLISAYNHASWSGQVPVGKGRVYENGNEAIFEGRFWLETAAGRETYNAVKLAGDLQEYSYGFDILKSSDGERENRRVRMLEGLKVYEVSPVLVGAGLNTRTLGIKSGLTFADHSEGLLTDLAEYVQRAKSLADLRVKEGRTLSSANMARLESLAAQMRGALEELESLLESAKPAKGLEVDMQKLHMEFLRLQTQRSV